MPIALNDIVSRTDGAMSGYVVAMVGTIYKVQMIYGGVPLRSGFFIADEAELMPAPPDVAAQIAALAVEQPPAGPVVDAVSGEPTVSSPSASSTPTATASARACPRTRTSRR